MKYDLDLDELGQNKKSEYLELVGSAQWVSNNSRPDVVTTLTVMTPTIRLASLPRVNHMASDTVD